MEQNEISIHEVRVVQAMQANAEKWLSNKDIAELVQGVSPRTVRAKTAKLVTIGLLDVAEVFPSHRYRWSDKAKQRNAAYLNRLAKAAEVFGG